jgi:hypothetical protein
MLCHAVPCCAMLCYAVLCCAMLCHAVPCCAMLCHAVPCCAMLGHAGPCWAMLGHAGPCWAMLGHAGPCWAMLEIYQSNSTVLMDKSWLSNYIKTVTIASVVSTTSTSQAATPEMTNEAKSSPFCVGMSLTNSASPVHWDWPSILGMPWFRGHWSYR